MRMNTKKALLRIGIFFIFSALLTAGGKEEAPYDKAEGVESWSYEYDVSQKESGRYNIIVKGEDTAGNTSTAGPFNITIDKSTDLPLVSVVNPLDGDLIKDSLNVVGSAYDDDGISKVEMSFDDGPYLECQGKEFWSRLIPRDELSDGSHTLKIRAVDINGLPGEESLVSFRVDKDLPVVTIESHDKGAYLSGKVSLTGTVQDSSGIEEFKFYHREQDRQGLIKLSYNKKRALHEFEYKMNTEDFEDGPHNLTFSCTDSSGSKAEESFLFFADNNPPEIEILTPEEGEEVNQTLILSGRVRDQVGMESLTGYLNDEEINIELLPGSTFWYSSIDLDQVSFGNLTLKLTALDRSGNSSEEKIKIKHSEESDLPVVEIHAPVKIGVEESSVEVGILVSDDDGVKEIEYVLDEGSPETSALTRGEILSFPRLDPGKHTLKVRASDINGTWGEYEQVSLNVPSQSEKAPLSPVSEIILSEKLIETTGNLSLEGEFRGSGSGTVLEYGMSEGKDLIWKPLSGEGKFTINESNLAQGSHVIHVRARSGEENVSYTQAIVIKDSEIPSLSLLSPLEGEKVNGKIVLSGYIHDFLSAPLVEFSDDGETYRTLVEGNSFYEVLDLNTYEEYPPRLYFRSTDAMGNSDTLILPLESNRESDIPVITLHYPQTDSLITGPANITGTAVDDDGVGSISYKFSEEDVWQNLEGNNTFSIPFDPGQAPDGDYTIYLKCEDLGGLESAVLERTFPVSRTAPVVQVTSPSHEEYLKGRRIITGTAQDDNGIKEVYVSTDNGMSYKRASGQEEWFYDLDTSVLFDGTHSLYVRAVDNSGTLSYFTTIINVDNTSPVIKMDSPAANGELIDFLDISGIVSDGNELTSVSYTIVPMALAPAAEEIPSAEEIAVTSDGIEAITEDSVVEESALPLPTVPLSEPDGVSLLNQPAPEQKLTRRIELAGKTSGWYTLSLEAMDSAGNISRTTRNIIVKDSDTSSGVSLLYPLEGGTANGYLQVEGIVENGGAADNVRVLLDGNPLASIPLAFNGYFSHVIEGDVIPAGDHSLLVEYGDKQTEERTFTFIEKGPWIKFSDLKTGDYLTERTFIEGSVGYIESEDETVQPVEEPVDDGDSKKKREKKEKVQKIESPEIDRIEISYNGGRSKEIIPGNKVKSKKDEEAGSWKIRFETENYADGGLPVTAKAFYSDGTFATAEIYLNIDKKAPQVTIAAPSEGEGFNDSISVSGNSGDSNGMKEVTLLLREGDKNSYELPSFVQGLFLDFHALGATYGEIGAGLTFFDDNVKLQGFMGVSPPGRFSGLVLGGKLLANVASVPYRYIFGPDMQDFSTSFALGANFSYFTMSGEELGFTDSGVVLGSVLGQWEIIKYEAPGRDVFKSYSLYAEGTLWFISSDVQAGLVPRFSIGARIGVF